MVKWQEDYFYNKEHNEFLGHVLNVLNNLTFKQRLLVFFSCVMDIIIMPIRFIRNKRYVNKIR